jgi:hypothetical protein
MSNATPARTSVRGGRGAIVGIAIVVASGAAAALILTGHRTLAGVAAAVAAALLLVGMPAAADRRAVFARHLLDLLFEACVLVPVTWVERASAPRVAALALLGLGASFVASYERAKGVGLGYRATESWPYRAIKDGLLVLGLVSGWLEATLWAYLAMATFAAAVRAFNVANQERRRKAEAETGGRT